MKLQPIPFEQIRTGSKSIEVRLNDDKRRKLNVGDEIEFTLATDNSQKLHTQVIDLITFPTFRELFESLPPEEYGGTNADEWQNMYKYYSREDEEMYGVLAIKLKTLQ